MYVFGSGILIGTDSLGNSINFGLAQEVALDITTTTKTLYGQNNFPVAIGSGTRKFTGKTKMARISAHAFGQLFFGVVPSVGSVLSTYESAQTASYTATHGANFVKDLGVTFASTGLPLKLVTTTPTTGQYEVNSSTGVYTFFASDATTGAGLIVTYNYTAAAAGQSLPIVSTPIGPSVTFSASLFAQDPTTGGQFGLQLYSCVAEKMSFGTKLEDFIMPELDFQVLANAAGQVCQFNMYDAA